VSGCFECVDELPVFIKLAPQEVLCSIELGIVLVEMRERGRIKSMNCETVDTVVIFTYEYEIWCNKDGRKRREMQKSRGGSELLDCRIQQTNI
jgi:hypothetical protein